jgi:hypothetical protein
MLSWTKRRAGINPFEALELVSVKPKETNFKMPQAFQVS